jgi:multicomponent Na+:H+ antiporter subunit E
MSAFLTNLLLALVWALLRGSVDVANLGAGFVLGFLALLWLRPSPRAGHYTRKLPQAIGLGLFVVWELSLSTWRVALDVVTPRPRRRCAIVAVPLDAETDAEITVLANLITLTPGSISVDLSDDRRTLYVHGMFVDDPEAFRREIKDGFERRVLELLR